MGKENDVVLEYLDGNEYFADLFNGSYFDGDPVVTAKELEDASQIYWDNYYEEIQAGTADVIIEKRLRHTQRFRDLKKKLHSGNYLQILAIEHQSGVDHTMAWRHMYYDALEYKRQIKEIEVSKNDSQQKSVNNNLPKFTVEDKLAPAFTVCLYLGEEPWDGPRCLKDMMNFDEEEIRWEKLFSDYRMNLICVNEIEDFSKYHTSLKLLLMLLANRNSKKKMKKMMEENQEFKKVDKETARAAGKLLGVTPEMETALEQEGEETDMCTGLKEWLMDERSEGRAEGRAEGERSLLILQVQKKLDRGKTLEVIADEVEQDVETIAVIIEEINEMKGK